MAARSHWRLVRPVPGLALALAVIAGPVAALSCRPWSPADAYLEAARSDKAFNVLKGRIAFDEALLPKAPEADPNAAPPQTRIPARFEGLMLDRGGFTFPVDVPVTLEVICLGPWCGGAAAGAAYIAFAEQRGDELVIQADPCGGFLFAGSAEAEQQVLDCHGGRKCRPARQP